MYKTQILTTKGEEIKVFYTQTIPQTRFASEGVEVYYDGEDNSFIILGGWNIVIEKIKK